MIFIHGMSFMVGMNVSVLDSYLKRFERRVAGRVKTSVYIVCLDVSVCGWP